MAATSSEPSITDSTSFTPPSTVYTPSTSTLPSGASATSFTFPAYTSFPPFYTLQPNLTTRARQLELWSDLITSYSQFHHLFRLSLSSLPQDLFNNTQIHRALKAADIRTVLEHMSKPANGNRVEWVSSTTKGEQSGACYVFWRTAAEWADMLYAWVDETGQKGSVLTVYELREGPGVRGKEWRDMDEGMLRKVLNVLIKRGKAQVFGQAESEGVKFF